MTQDPFMKHSYLIGCCVLVALAAGAAAAHLTIRHEQLPLFDSARHRSVPIDLYVRPDAEFESRIGVRRLPVAIINQGNTVGSDEYCFIADVFAARGYLVASIQHDLPTDPPLSMSGSPYLGRLPQYQRGLADIKFVIGKLRKLYPDADYARLTLIGHSNGGDVSVFYAADHPKSVATLITLDNLRVPLDIAQARTLSFRSLGGAFKPDIGVVPGRAEQKQDGIEVVMTGAPHTELSDRGPTKLKEWIADELSRFLDDHSPQPKRRTVLFPEPSPGIPV
jgi:hypothetical protein